MYLSLYNHLMGKQRLKSKFITLTCPNDCRIFAVEAFFGKLCQNTIIDIIL